MATARKRRASAWRTRFAGAQAATQQQGSTPLFSAASDRRRPAVDWRRETSTTTAMRAAQPFLHRPEQILLAPRC